MYDNIVENLKMAFPNGKVPAISEDINFWMVRSKGGAFYSEFIAQKYIAIGWNYINMATDLKSDMLPRYLKENHPFVNQTTKAINKCNHFINGMKKNDIVVIVGKATAEITIALVGEYYENSDFDVEKENEVYSELANGRVSDEDIKCPYIKRRIIYPIRTVSTAGMNPHLYRTLRNYNGLDDINEHAELILGLIYNAFIYKEKLHINLEINQKDAIKLSAISGLLYGTNCYFKDMTEDDDISAKVSACSEGLTEIIISEGIELVSKYGDEAIIIFICLLVAGYVVTKVDVPKFIKDVVCLPTAIAEEKKQLKLKTKQLELENKEKELDIAAKAKKVDELLNQDRYKTASQILEGVSVPLSLSLIDKDSETMNLLSNIEKKDE